MSTTRKVRIDAFPGSAFRYLDRDAIVCVDVISCSTTIVTAVAQGRPVYPVAGIDEALTLAGRLSHPLLAVEQPREGAIGFDMGNSPASVSGRDDHWRPLILAGTAGTQLLLNAAAGEAVYVACLRNVSATAEHLAEHHRQVVILGAGWGSEFRCEDQMAAGRIGRRLVELGFECEDVATADIVERWGSRDLSFAALGRSAAYLRRGGLHADLAFVLEHVDDLDLVCRFADGVASEAPRSQPERAAASGERSSKHGQVLPFRLATQTAV